MISVGVEVDKFASICLLILKKNLVTIPYLGDECETDKNALLLHYVIRELAGFNLFVSRDTPKINICGNFYLHFVLLPQKIVRERDPSLTFLSQCSFFIPLKTSENLW